MTPLDIRKQTFRRVMRGYDPEEIQAFLEMMAEEFERLNRENIELRERETVLKSDVERYRSLEKTLQDTLTTAQDTAEEVRENARKEASLIVKEAEILGNRAIEKARSRVQTIRSEIVNLKNRRDLFVSKFQALLQAQSDFLSRLSLTEPEVVKESIDDLGTDGERAPTQKSAEAEK